MSVQEQVWNKFTSDPKPYPFEEFEHLESDLNEKIEKRLFRTNLKPRK